MVNVNLWSLYEWSPYNIIQYVCPCARRPHSYKVYQYKLQGGYFMLRPCVLPKMDRLIITPTSEGRCEDIAIGFVCIYVILYVSKSKKSIDPIYLNILHKNVTGDDQVPDFMTQCPIFFCYIFKTLRRTMFKLGSKCYLAHWKRIDEK